jgi:two-component system chemotaxis response regulator CheY
VAKTVLIVDDSMSIRKMVGYTLTQAGFAVVEGANGQEALAQMDAHPVDLIVTDLNMPVMDGIAFIRQVRSRPGAKGIPVLMLTTESQDAKKQEGKAAGATGWIVKPFHPDKLLEVLTGSIFAAPIYRNYGAMIAKKQFEPVGFRMPLGLKDNRLVLAAAEEAAVPLPMASLIRDRFLTAMAQGLSDADWSAIARISFQDAGLEKAA